MNIKLWINKKRFGKWRFFNYLIYGANHKFALLQISINLMNPFTCYYAKSFWRKYLRVFCFVISWSRLNEKS